MPPIHISRGGDLCAPQMARENLNLKAFLGVLTLIPNCIHLTSKIDSVYLRGERGDDYVINANGFLEAREGSAFVSGQLFTRDEPKRTMYDTALEQYSEGFCQQEGSKINYRLCRPRTRGRGERESRTQEPSHRRFLASGRHQNSGISAPFKMGSLIMTGPEAGAKWI